MYLRFTSQCCSVIYDGCGSDDDIDNETDDCNGRDWLLYGASVRAQPGTVGKICDCQP